MATLAEIGYKWERIDICCRRIFLLMSGQTKPNKTGMTRLLRATACSWKGFRYIWNNEEAFRQEVVLCMFCIPLGVLLGDSGLERALLIGSVLLILLVELLNTAIECTIDRIGTEHHELSGNAKDLGSSAVTLSIFITMIVWALILST